MEILSVISGEPLFTVRHGKTDIGVVHPYSFAFSEADGKNLLLGGRSWRVAHVDWNQKVAYAEPATFPGTAHWPGDKLTLGYDVCQSVRALIKSNDISPRWSKRAADKMTAIRENMPWLETGAAAFSAEKNGLRWWTFAGDLTNRVICLLLKDQFQIVARPTGFSILMPGGLGVKAAKSMIERIRTLSDATRTLPIDDDLINGLKFSQCLPIDTARKMIRKRIVIPETYFRGKC